MNQCELCGQYDKLQPQYVLVKDFTPPMMAMLRVCLSCKERGDNEDPQVSEWAANKAAAKLKMEYP